MKRLDRIKNRITKLEQKIGPAGPEVIVRIISYAASDETCPGYEEKVQEARASATGGAVLITCPYDCQEPCHAKRHNSMTEEERADLVELVGAIPGHISPEEERRMLRKASREYALRCKERTTGTKFNRDGDIILGEINQEGGSDK